jgi:hypothetical protein
MQSITSDMIRAGSKNGSVIGFVGVIGSALATVMPKAEPIVPMKAPGCHWEGGFTVTRSGYRKACTCSMPAWQRDTQAVLPDGEAAALAEYMIFLCGHVFEMKVTIPMGRLQRSTSKPTGINLRSNSSMSNPTSGISAVRLRLYRAWSVGRPHKRRTRDLGLRP